MTSKLPLGCTRARSLLLPPSPTARHSAPWPAVQSLAFSTPPPKICRLADCAPAAVGLGCVAHEHGPKQEHFRKGWIVQQEVLKLHGACGYAILCAVQSFVERLGTAAFFDDKLTSETYAERVKSCPGCDEQLGFLTLLLRIQPR